MRDSLIKDIESVTEEIMQGYECYLVGVAFTSAMTGGGVVLRVYIDADGGVSVSMLSDVSRELGMILDVKELMDFKYTLEVSSPGINRIILKFDDYKKYKGKRVKVSLRKKIDGRLNLIGEIMDTEDGAEDNGPCVKIFDETEHSARVVPFYQIKKGNLLVI